MSYVDSLLSEDEQILHVSRQHWFILAPSVVGMTLFALIVVGASAAVFVFLPGTFVLAALALLVFLVIPIIKLSFDVLRWRSRSLVITDRRVMRVEGVLSKSVLDSSLEKVNDVALHQSLCGRLFDYGDLEILTASESGANRFERIAHPVTCKTVMLDQKLLLDQDSGATSSPPDIPTQIAKLAALRQKGIVTDAEFETKKAELLNRM